MSHVSIVTGASRGLGFVLARELARREHALVVTARGRQALDAAADALTEAGAERVIAVQGDVTDPAHRTRVVDAVRALGGRVDVLANNASTLGVATDPADPSDSGVVNALASPLPALAEYPLKTLAHAFDVNVIAPVALVQDLLPFLESARGLVVNVSSDAAQGGYEGWGGYGATKAALDLVTRTLANELRAKGVAAVSVDPGDMRTRMHQDAFPGEDITDRPTPDATIPFWAWLLAQDPLAVTGARYRAQEDAWTLPQ